jgi:tetratricopeptide (TPR) repeat protein
MGAFYAACFDHLFLPEAEPRCVNAGPEYFANFDAFGDAINARPIACPYTATMSERLDQLQKLYEADPNDPFVPYGIALELGKAEDYEQAIAWLDTALETDAHYHYAYFQKAKMLAALDRSDEARRTIEVGLTKAVEAGDEKARGELEELLASM